jgi:hypothetical protein
MNGNSCKTKINANNNKLMYQKEYEKLLKKSDYFALEARASASVIFC